MFRTRTQKISFADAELYIRENTLERLGRSQEQEEHYSEQTSQLKMEWFSISDFILHDKFCFKYVEGEDGRKKVLRPLPPPNKDDTTVEATATALRRNDHPYFFTDDVEHFVLWKLGAEAATEEEIHTAVTSLQEEEQQQQQEQQEPLGKEGRYRACLNYTSFQNPPSLMSIPEVHHAHVLVQRAPHTQQTHQQAFASVISKDINFVSLN